MIYRTLLHLVYTFFPPAVIYFLQGRFSPLVVNLIVANAFLQGIFLGTSVALIIHMKATKSAIENMEEDLKNIRKNNDTEKRA